MDTHHELLILCVLSESTAWRRVWPLLKAGVRELIVDATAWLASRYNIQWHVAAAF
jgi:hypothetical protein